MRYDMSVFGGKPPLGGYTHYDPIVRSSSGMFFRSDTRPDLTMVEPSKMYYDQDEEIYKHFRKKGVKGELSFSNTIGGALYGGIQTATIRHYDLYWPWERTQSEDFLDDTIIMNMYVYATKEHYDYVPLPDEISVQSGIDSDFETLGEVRYTRPVDVGLIGIYPVTKRDIAILSTLIFNNAWYFFDFDESSVGTEVYKEYVKRIADRDNEFIREHLINTPAEKRYPYPGPNLSTVEVMMDHFEENVGIIDAKPFRVRGVGRSGWFGEPQRHALASRGVRTR